MPQRVALRPPIGRRLAGAMLVGVFERFTDRARRVLVLPQEEAQQLGHRFIGTEHILGLIHEGGGVAAGPRDGRAAPACGPQVP